MLLKFQEFLDSLILEELHPELHSIITSQAPDRRKKQTQLVNKIKDLSSRGERTGIEGNMPKGSSRAYLKHAEPHEITLDGQKTHMQIGTKVAIRAALDKHHNHAAHDGMSLGALQNHAEGGDHWVNNNYRILRKGDNHGEYHKNYDTGIFPPLVDHDHEHHQWSQVGHARDIKPGEFRKLTKTPEHPDGISHEDFTKSLNRFHERNNGKYWTRDSETHLDHVDKHPLVQKFQDYHGNTGNPTYDYQQKKNLGVFESPDGSKHIVARDHGYNIDVSKAYQNAHEKAYNRRR